VSRSRATFILIIIVALCIVAAGAIGNEARGFLLHLPTPISETIIVTATPPIPTVTPFPTDTPRATLAPLPTATSGSIQTSVDVTPAPVPTASRLDARASQFLPIRSSDGALYFVGEIINTGDQPLERPEVAIVLYDSTGQVLANERGFSTQDYVAPGQRVPVRIIFTSPPAQWAKFQVLFTPQAATGENLFTYSDLTPLELKFVRSATIGHSISGTVKNSGMRDARYVQVIVTLYGANGQVVGVGEDLASPDSLAPNETASFNVTIYHTAAEPVSYRVQFIANTP